MIKTLGLSHPTLVAAEIEATVDFYSRLLGMALVMRQPDADNPGFEQLLFAAGNDTYIGFYGPSHPDLNSYVPRPTMGVGALQQLTLAVSSETFVQVKGELTRAGVSVFGPLDTALELAYYFRDPNGIMLALTSWKHQPPPGLSRATILATAEAIRAEAGGRLTDAQVQAAYTRLSSVGGGEIAPEVLGCRARV